MQRAARTKVVSVALVIVVAVSTFAFLSFFLKPARADEGGCSSVVYTLKWVKQIDSGRLRQLFVSTVPKGDDDSRTLLVDALPQKIYAVRLSDGVVIWKSSDLDVTYGAIPNDVYSGGVVSSEEGGYTAWVTTSELSRTVSWLHIVCNGNQGKNFTPTYATFNLKGLVDPTSHKTVNLVPTNVAMTQNGRYVAVGGYDSYIAVFQRTSGDDD